MVEKLIYNAIRTPDGTVLVSYNRHDYKTHLDANGEEYSIDGGTDYIRTSVNKEPAESLAVYDDEPFEILRQYISRGGRGKSGKEPLKHVVLKDISDSWLDNIISYEETIRPHNPQLKWYRLEKEFRNGKDI